VAGLVLVFLGVVLSTLGGFPGDTPDAVVRPFRRAAYATLGVFALGLIVVALRLAWLVLSDDKALYDLGIVLFSLLLVATLALAIRCPEGGCLGRWRSAA
jgi:hypothetical protein